MAIESHLTLPSPQREEAKTFLPRAVCAFSTRDYDASQDLERFLEALGLGADRWVMPKQVHGNGVIEVTGPLAPESLEADGLVTKARGLALMIRTADCVPLFLLDPEVPAVGIVHVGWRGAKAGIVECAMTRFRESFGTRPGRLQVAIGPAICSHCYEVGEEFHKHFPGFIRVRQGRLTIDLKGFVKKQLKDRGVRREGIQDAGLCTFCSGDRFFSARREGEGTGRMISLAVLK